jgi:hypothetical protein
MVSVRTMSAYAPWGGASTTSYLYVEVLSGSRLFFIEPYIIRRLLILYETHFSTQIKPILLIETQGRIYHPLSSSTISSPCTPHTLSLWLFYQNDHFLEIMNWSVWIETILIYGHTTEARVATSVLLAVAYRLRFLLTNCTFVFCGIGPSPWSQSFWQTRKIRLVHSRLNHLWRLEAPVTAPKVHFTEMNGREHDVFTKFTFLLEYIGQPGDFLDIAGSVFPHFMVPIWIQTTENPLYNQSNV